VGESPRLLASLDPSAEGGAVSTAEERARSVIEPILADLHLDLYDFEYAGGVLKITIDKDGGVDLESLSLATRLISRDMDHHDPISSRYTLEVSSPGLERHLRTPSHFQRIVGWTVNVRTHSFVEGDRRVQGELIHADENGIVVRAALKKNQFEERSLSYGDIERARTVFVWEKQSKSTPSRKPSISKKEEGTS
jgi:ribosome maturation factor RimP